MAIPSTLIELGRAVEITVDNDTWEFPRIGRFLLCCPVSGKRSLFIISAYGQPKKVISSSLDGHKINAQIRQKFSGHKIDGYSELKVTEKKLTVLGRCKSIVYESDKYGNSKKQYIHEFKSKPLVKVDSKKEPRFVIVNGSKIKINERGILG